MILGREVMWLYTGKALWRKRGQLVHYKRTEPTERELREDRVPVSTCFHTVSTVGSPLTLQARCGCEEGGGVALCRDTVYGR